MPTPIVIPELGADELPVMISSWLVDPGEAVESGDRLVELLVAGVTFDVAAPAAGVLQAVERDVNSQVAPGEIVGWIAELPEEEQNNDLE
jgi:pyruvate/2-oxoglutarate dehydrogenase complex dihydrolipoamide acyltransferase (E2) component